jgi:signal transduction histidine kinase/streptogramin lyase
MAETTRSVHPLVLPPDQQSVEPEIQVGSAGILFDDDGSLWITSIGDGMRRVPFPDRLNGQKIGEFSDAIESFTAKEGLTSDYLTCILKDREGNIWVGSSVGLDQFRRGALVPILLPAKFTRKTLVAGDDGKILMGSYSPALAEIEGNTWKNVEPGGAMGAILSGFRDPHGTIWLLEASAKGPANDEPTYHVWRLEKGALNTVAEMPDVSHDYLAALAEDRTGNLWIGNGADLFFLENGRWVRFESPSEVAGKQALVTFTDIDGRVWFGFTDNTIVVIDGTNVRTFSSKEGVQVGSVTAITGRDRHIWIAGKGGLEAWQGDRFRPVVPADGDAFHGVSGVQENSGGDLLLSEQRGVVLVSASEVSKILKDPSTRVEYHIFDVRDGLPGTIQQGSPYPISVEGTDGRIWFSTSSGVAWIDPAHIPKNALPPPIVIRSLTANGVRYPLLSDLKLPPRTQDLTIDYTALSLAVPERVRFRYKLEGSDTQWQDPGGRRQAFYNNLSAGSYRFEVVAANDDGVWNEQAASVNFKIEPAFYETVWFRLCCILAGLLILASAYRWRLRQILQRVDTLHNERIVERERIARDLHDTLLQSVQGIILRFHATLLRMRENDPLRAEIEDTLLGANRVLQEGRDKVSGLRGTWDTNPNIEAALAELARELAQQSASTIRITTEGESRQLTAMACDEIYRIGAEALVNAVRHADAEEVEVEIALLARELRLRVRDNGRGIPADILDAGARSGHWGLPGMRERAIRLHAKLTIWSNPGAGTEIELRVPAFVAYGRRKDSGLRKVLAKLGIPMGAKDPES